MILGVPRSGRFLVVMEDLQFHELNSVYVNVKCDPYGLNYKLNMCKGDWYKIAGFDMTPQNTNGNNYVSLVLDGHQKSRQWIIDRLPDLPEKHKPDIKFTRNRIYPNLEVLNEKCKIFITKQEALKYSKSLIEGSIVDEKFNRFKTLEL